MSDQPEPRPFEQFHPSDKRIISKIDAALAGYVALLPTFEQPSFPEQQAEPMEIDRSPHPRHGVPTAAKDAATLVLKSEAL